MPCPLKVAACPYRLIAASLIVLIASPHAALAAALDGAMLGWALPFIGILLTIGAGPLLFAKLWHHHYCKFAFGWSAVLQLLPPLAITLGPGTALAAFVHAALTSVFAVLALLIF